MNDRLDDFIQQFWSDVDKAQVEPVEAYVTRFPELEQEIRAEYAHLDETVDGADADALPPLAPAIPEGPAPAPRRGTTIGRYVVERFLAQGGQGTVYLGHDPTLDRPVVLKTIASFATKAAERLRREARLLGRIDDPGVCPVLDVVDEGEREFVVMPFIDGETLADKLAAADPARPHAWAEAIGAPHATTETVADEPAENDLRPVLRLMERIARIVDAAHEAGVVHRDLKPSNVMCRPTGEPMVLDFGLAFDVGEATRFTTDGAVLGTPAYMAPEQVNGDLATIDRRTDVYALGVMLYEMLTLRVPFEDRAREGLYRKILAGDPLLPHKHESSIPRDVEAVCLKAMDVEPKRRYATAGDFAEDLRRCRMLKPTDARHPTAIDRLWRRAKRHPLTAVSLVALVASALVVVYLIKRVDTTSSSKRVTEALFQIREAQFQNVRPDDAWFRVLDDAGCPPAVVAAFKANPLDEKHVAALRTWNDHRNTPAKERHFVGLLPVGVREVAPAEIVFESTIDDADSLHLLLTVEGPSGLTSLALRGAERIGKTPAGVRFRLPVPPETWTATGPHAWTIGLDLSRYDDLPAEERGPQWTSNRVAFRRVDGSAAERVLATVPATKDADTRKILGATALLEASLPASALDLLADLPRADASRHLAASVHFLRARAHALRGDRRAFDAAQASLCALGATATIAR